MTAKIIQWCADVCSKYKEYNPQSVAGLYLAWEYFKMIVESEEAISDGDILTMNCHFYPLLKLKKLSFKNNPQDSPTLFFEEYVNMDPYPDVNPNLIANLISNFSSIDNPIVY